MVAILALLWLSMKTLPLGTAYMLWTGIGLSVMKLDGLCLGVRDGIDG